MTTTIRVEYNEQSKCVVASTKVESDEMTAADVLQLAKEVALEAQAEAKAMTMRKLI